jgi:hypothetical protein
MDARQTSIIRGMLKSKTITLNSVLSSAILFVAIQYGFDDAVTPETAAMLSAGIFTAMNIVVRFFTDRSIRDKGAIRNPFYSEEFINYIEENPEAVDRLIQALKKRITDQKEKVK